MSSNDSNTSHAFSTKAGGSMKKEDGTVDFANIEKFLSTNNLSSDYITMGQVHDGNIAVVLNKQQKRIEGVDALITNIAKLNLCILTADCLPILIHDDKKNVIAAVHAGRKGLVANIIHNTLAKFKDMFQSNPEDMYVAIGPSIEQKCYEVSEEVIHGFKEQFDWFDETYYTTSSNNRFLLDLRKIAKHCLMKEGILKEHISISDQCTKCGVNTLYSYRRGDTNGRFVSVISLV